jgi:TPP-dependent trihydroxycyclohexane-1,2-dione (THcHDO) dehydratase
MRHYNQLISRHKALLNDAYQAQQAAYRETHGTRWQAKHDQDMTRMYNGFANVRDRRRFCAAAAGIAADAAEMPSPRLAAVAGRMLRALDPDAPALVASAR